MSLLSDYEQRTAWKYAPIRGAFHTADGLANKVQPDGSYAPFPGSTLVFRMRKPDLYVIELMQQLLYRQLEGTEMLAERLPASTIHMTLHDLVSPENAAQHGAEILERAAAIVEEIHGEFAGRRIVMVADRIVNMVAKSLVLMLRPQTELDYALLLEMYRRFDALVRLPYPLTPHITLAYFRPGMLDGDRLGAAVDFAQINPENAPVFEFDAEALTAQTFRDMRSYQDVPERICFCCDGGRNRSVLAAQLLNHMAAERGLPVRAEARSAYPNTRGLPVPQAVWHALEAHGIHPRGTDSTVRDLEEREVSHFSSFAGITDGAMERFSWLGLPEERLREASSIFYGVRDPEYGEITYEAAFEALRERVERYLDALEAGMRGRGGDA